jgi:hypothetical protein
MNPATSLMQPRIIAISPVVLGDIGILEVIARAPLDSASW